MVRKVFVDRNLCVACSICTRVCPEVFVEIKPDKEHGGNFKCFTNNKIDHGKFADKIQEAINSCPAHCISWRGKGLKQEVKGKKLTAKTASTAGVKASKLKVVLCTVLQDINIKRESGELPLVPKIAMTVILKWIRKFGGYKGEFYDIDAQVPSDKEIADYFKERQPDVVGISAVVSTSYSQVKKLANTIRKTCPSAWIVLGGYMAASANVLLRKTEVDVCVLGDGEIQFVSFLDYVEKNGRKKNYKELAKIKGLAFLNDKKELEITGYGDPIPASERDIYDFSISAQGLGPKSDMLEKYYFRAAKKCSWFNHDKRTYEPHRKQKVARVWFAKGCVSRCTFCQRFSCNYTAFDLKKLDHHLAELKKKYNVQFIDIIDETFGSNKKYAYGVAKLLKKHDFLWCATGIRCTSLKKDDIKFLRDHGCTGLKFGVESGSQKILDIMEKRFTTSNVYTALKTADEYGLYSPLAFCVGMPGETDETVTESGKFFGKIARMQGVPPCDIEMGIFYALPLPGAPLYEYAQLRGVIGATPEEEEAYLMYISDKDTGKDHFINLTGISTRKTRFWEFLMVYEAMREYYNSPLPENNKKNSLKHNTYLPYSGAVSGKGKSPVKKAVSSLTLKTLARYLANPVTYLNKVMVRSRLVAKLPCWFVYGTMRNLLHFEYIVRVLFRSIKGFGNKKQVPLLKEAESLRVVNQKIRAALPKPKTLTEKNRITLLLGR